MSTGIWIIIIVAVAVVFSVVSFLVGYNNRKRIAEKAIGSAETEALNIVEEA